MRRLPFPRLGLLLGLLGIAVLAGCDAAPPTGPNVLLVTVETFRTDHFGARRGEIALTPEMDALAERGTRFDRAFAAAAFTLPSVHTIATAEPPPVHRVRFWTQFGNLYRGTTLAETFQEAGYRTGMISGHGFLGTYPVLRRGCDAFDESREARAAWILERARSQMDAAREAPFFLWVHLYEPHTPYAPETRFAQGVVDLEAYEAAGPAPYPVDDWLPRVPDDDGPALADALYAAEVRAADSAVGALLSELETRGISGRTVVCVVGDHGENLSQDAAPRWDHGWSVEPQLIRVPLILAGPGVDAGRADDDVARHLDLAPTLLRLAGVDGLSDGLGRDLLGGAAPPRFAIAESTIHTRQDRPFFSVTDGRTALRIDPSEGSALLVDESGPGAPQVPIDAGAPPPGARGHLQAWSARTDAVLERAVRLNASGVDDQRLTEEQEALLRMSGYLR